jgi:hypothetical protein
LDTALGGDTSWFGEEWEHWWFSRLKMSLKTSTPGSVMGKVWVPQLLDGS